MNVMFASDIHGSAYYCEKMLERYTAEKAEKLILLGDLLYHGPRNDLPRDYAPKEVIKMLCGLKDNIIAVRGNCDAEVDGMVLNFDIMKPDRKVYIDGHMFFLTHGHHWNKEHPFEYSEKYVLMNGHFHIPEIYDTEKFLYINTGSISIPKGGSQHSYAAVHGGTLYLKNLDGEIFDSINF